MACVTIPPITPPVLPAPFSLPSLPLPAIPVPGACCQLPPIPIPTGIISLGVLNPAFIAGVNAAMSAISAYINALPIGCPKE